MSLTLAHLRICLSNCMDVSEGRKALHHRQARSIHERKLLSLSLRAGFHKHTCGTTKCENYAKCENC